MRIVAIVARILLGLIFLIFGLNGFLHFIPSPPIPGLAGAFLGALIASHYFILVSTVQVIAGALLLADQYVPLALVLLAAVLINILTFHLTMQPSGLPPGIVSSILWLIVASRYRAQFAPLLLRKPAPQP